MGADGQQVPAPFQAGAPKANWVNYPADQIEQWALATQPGKVSGVGEAYWAIGGLIGWAW